MPVRSEAAWALEGVCMMITVAACVGDAALKLAWRKPRRLVPKLPAGLGPQGGGYGQLRCV